MVPSNSCNHAKEGPKTVNTVHSLARPASSPTRYTRNREGKVRGDEEAKERSDSHSLLDPDCTLLRRRRRRRSQSAHSSFVPLFLFLSLSVSDNQLASSSNGLRNHSPAMSMCALYPLVRWCDLRVPFFPDNRCREMRRGLTVHHTLYPSSIALAWAVRTICMKGKEKKT